MNDLFHFQAKRLPFLLSGMNPFHHTFSFEPKVISYYENGKKAHPRGVCQSDKDTPLHSFHFQKIKKFVFLKVGDYIKTIKRSKYIDRIIELKNNLAAQGRYTDAVDDVLCKVLEAKKKKLKIEYI